MPTPKRDRFWPPWPGRRRLAGLAVLAALASACGDGPAAPTSRLTAPTLVSPTDDAVAGTPAILVVNNASTTASGPKTYDFALADTQAAVSGGSPNLMVTGAPEGAGGQTSIAVSVQLKTGSRYYWRSRAVQGGVAGPWSSVFRFRTDHPPNAAPVIGTFLPSSQRVESDAEVSFIVSVADPEPTPGPLAYEWTAPSGKFTGSDANARWRAPIVTQPTDVTLTLTVIERYTVTDPDGRPETRENRATVSTVVHVNDSRAEISSLVLMFLDDFVHSERSPEYCVRNFTDGCQGKQWELDDIRNNRRDFVNNPSQSSFNVQSITFNGATTRATVLAPCRFASTNRHTGQSGVAVGTCRLISVYENWRWYLCESWFDPPFNSAFDAFSKQFIF